MLGRLQSGIPQLPPISANQDLLTFRKSLPIWGMRDDILHLVNNNQVAIMVGETGCGKTTQVSTLNLCDSFKLFIAYTLENLTCSLLTICVSII